MAHTKVPTYRVIATNLHPSEITEADRVAAMLRDEGWPRATRSMVIREALARLQEDLRGKTSGEVFRDFIDRHAKRLTAREPASSRRPAD